MDQSLLRKQRGGQVIPAKLVPNQSMTLTHTIEPHFLISD
jgi:hypothetical protein